ncbi:protein PDF [Lutzomyia longipalpis]|nr:protein PDF [Lutzomyia longipalpis]
MHQNCANPARIFGLFLAWQLLLHTSLAMPVIDEENYDRELAHNFVPAWSVAAFPSAENPCQPTLNNAPWNFLMPPQLHKRNSELINSLLSLPKTMNDAGK